MDYLLKTLIFQEFDAIKRSLICLWYVDQSCLYFAFVLLRTVLFVFTHIKSSRGMVLDG